MRQPLNYLLILPFSFSFSCCSNLSLTADLTFRLPPSLGPFSTSTSPRLSPGRGAGFAARRFWRRLAMASRNSRLNSSAMRSSAGVSSAGGEGGAGVSSMGMLRSALRESASENFRNWEGVVRTYVCFRGGTSRRAGHALHHHSPAYSSRGRALPS